jgi:ankyrin repeat protein
VSTDDLTSALHAACFRGQLLLVQLTVRALGRHCNIHVLNGSLHTAASRCHSEVVDWLLRLTHPTDADHLRYNLVQASARGDLTRVTQLVDTIGPDVTDVMSYALWAACYWGRIDIVDWLMTHTSADVNYSGERCFGIGSLTSLAIACYEGHMTVVKRLLTDATSSCDVNIVVGVRCNTALHEIIWYTRQTQLHESCGRGDTAAVVDTVRQCDVNMQDRDGMTALHCACVSGRLDTVAVLLSVFADINITADDGRSPIAMCEYFGHPELANYVQQHSHSMYVSGDNVNNSNMTVSGHTLTTITQTHESNVNTASL